MGDIKSFIQEQIEELTFTHVEFDEALISSKLMDSITLVDLMVAIEDETGKKIPANDVTEENFDTIAKIEAYLSTLN